MLDKECFVLKYRKSKSSGRKMGNYKAKEIKVRLYKGKKEKN